MDDSVNVSQPRMVIHTAPNCYVKHILKGYTLSQAVQCTSYLFWGGHNMFKSKNCTSF